MIRQADLERALAYVRSSVPRPRGNGMEARSFPLLPPLRPLPPTRRRSPPHDLCRRTGGWSVGVSVVRPFGRLVRRYVLFLFPAFNLCKGLWAALKFRVELAAWFSRLTIERRYMARTSSCCVKARETDEDELNRNGRSRLAAAHCACP